MESAPRLPCSTCPWRRSTPRRGFPGGVLHTRDLLRAASGAWDAPAMQCHCTPDGKGAEVCVGFALVVGFRSPALRFARVTGRYDPDAVGTDEPLHTLTSVLRIHGGKPCDNVDEDLNP